MRRQTPPLQAIHAFVVAMRAPSFRAAADELAISASALSRRIETLEQFLGMPLFDRTGARPQLTAAGRAYGERVQPALDTIRRASLEVRAAPADAALRVQCSQSLAMNWFLPQTAQLREAGAAVSLTIGRDIGKVYTGLCDVGVFAAPRELHGLPAEPLLQLESAVVSSACMADGRSPPQQVEDIAGHTLLAPDDPPAVWDGWLARLRQRPATVRQQLYNTIAMSYEAAAAGLGLGLGLSLHVDRYLREDRLRFCFGEARCTGYAYVLVYASEAVQRRTDARRFSAWMHDAVQASQRTFRAALGRCGDERSGLTVGLR